MSDYPNNIDYFTEKVDQITDCKANDINSVQEAITQIETVLGINPQGDNQPSGWSLADRLDVFINANGTLKSSVLTSSDIPNNSISNSKIFYNDTFEFLSVKTPGLITTSIAQLGQSATDVTEFTGNFRPSVDLIYDIGTNSKRVRRAYIDNVFGSQTGANTLTIAASAIFANTVIVRSDSDTVVSSGQNIGWIGKDNNGLVIQSATQEDLTLQPNEGDLKFRDSYLNEDTYNFFIKYPFIQDDLQQQFISEKSYVSEISYSIDGVTSSGMDVDISIDGNVILKPGIYNTIEDITTTFETKSDYTQNIYGGKGSILSLSIKTTADVPENLRVQVKMRRY